MAPLRRHPAVEVLSSRRILSGAIFDLLEEAVRLPSGRRQELLVLDHPGAVCVVPVLPSGDWLLVRQYRHALGDWQLEIPAGRLEAGEAPAVAAARELEEETGHRADELIPIRSFFVAPGFCNELMHLFLARGLHAVPGGGREPDPDEEIELVPTPPSELLAGGTRDAKTLLAAALLGAPPHGGACAPPDGR